MKRNIIKMLFTTILMFTIFDSLSVSAKVLTDDILQTTEFKYESQKKYIEEYGYNYEEVFNKNGIASSYASKINSFFKIGENKEKIYPDFFGGMYINDNNDLVVLISKKNEEKISFSDKKIYDEIFALSDDIKKEYVDEPYSKLEQVRNYVLDYMKNNLKGYVINLYTDIVRNTVVVGLRDYNSNNIEKFKKEVLSSNLLTFTQGEKILTSSDVKAGGPINSIGCSVGYRARKTLTGKGIVTAGHCVSLNQVVSGFGKAKNRTFGGDIDASWLDSADSSVSNVNPINTFHQYSGTTSPFSPLSTTVATSYTNGQEIGRVGKTSGCQTGTILNNNYSFIYDTGSSNILFTNQIYTNVTQLGGDSGGIVYLLSNRTTMGIGTFKMDSNNYMIFSRADKINNSFSISRY